jgi:hypothetical protein
MQWTWPLSYLLVCTSQPTNSLDQITHLPTFPWWFWGQDNNLFLALLKDSNFGSWSLSTHNCFRRYPGMDLIYKTPSTTSTPACPMLSLQPLFSFGSYTLPNVSALDHFFSFTLISYPTILIFKTPRFGKVGYTMRSSSNLKITFPKIISFPFLFQKFQSPIDLSLVWP